MNNKLKILLLLLYFAVTLHSQDVVTFETPYTKKYTRDDYNAHDQNWNITQDSLGLIYVSNNEALLIYDGEIWQKIKMQNAWGLKTNSKKEVYFGADNIFGKIEYGVKGNIIINSFTEQLEKNDKNTGIIQDIHFNGDTTYFIGFYSIYVSYKDEIIRVAKLKDRIIKSLIFNNKLYFNNSEQGIKSFEGEVITTIPINENLFGKRIHDIIKFENKKILLTSKGVFYTNDKQVDFVDGNFYNLDEDLSELIIRGGVDKCKLLSNSRIAFVSQTQGIVIFNLKTGYKTYLNKQTGLSTNSIMSVFEDKDKNLWLATYEGVNYVEINNPVSIISSKGYISDIITSINRIENDIFFTTLRGCYKIEKNNKSNQILIYDYKIDNSYTGVIEYENHLYATSVIGLGEIKNGEFNLIEEFSVTYLIRRIKQYPNYFILGGGGGLTIMKYENGNIRKIRNLESDNVDTRYIEEHNGYIWFSVDKGIVSRFKTEDVIKESFAVETFNFTNDNNKDNIYINIICDKVIVQEANIIKEFNYKDNKFVKTTLNDDMFIDGSIELSIKVDSAYYISNFNLIKSVTHNDGHYTQGGDFLKRINNIKTSSIFFDTVDKKVWLGGTNKIGVIDIAAVNPINKPYNTRIRNIRVNDSVFFYGFNLSDSITNVFQRKSKFVFNFAAQFYQAVEENKYSYILEGYDKEWSSWSDISFANYTNLEYGTYTFKVKAINIFGQESTVDEFTFSVEPAFYQKWYAHLMFVILIVLIIIFAIYLNGKRLKGINLKLEKQVEERTQEINEKNKELEKLSIVASETDNSVLIYDENYNLEWLNEGEIKNFGYTLDQIYKEFGRNIIDVSFYPKIKEIIKEIEETKESAHYNSKGNRSDGSEIWSRTTLTPILDENNNIYKIIAIDSDITELKHAEEEITRQNTLIKDSLEYAKKIQEAVLPSLNSLKETFKDAFVIFKPKDIVSGDFFWMHTIGNKTIVATADCTGHGVPGGFMSMIGNTMMNEIVKEKNITSPSFILNLMDEKMNNLFKDAESGQAADGMDVAVAVIDKTEGIVEVASANQSLYVVDDDEMSEFNGDMWSIGGVFSKKATGTFKSKIYTIGKNTTLFMSSDGYQDQFGGKDDTKILKTKFINLLSNISSKSSEEQELILNNYFIDWVNNGKQTDDILVIGIKL